MATDNCRGGRVLELGFGLGIAASEVRSFIQVTFWIESGGVKGHWMALVKIRYSLPFSVEEEAKLISNLAFMSK